MIKILLRLSIILTNPTSLLIWSSQLPRDPQSINLSWSSRWATGKRLEKEVLNCLEVKSKELPLPDAYSKRHQSWCSMRPPQLLIMILKSRSKQLLMKLVLVPLLLSLPIDFQLWETVTRSLSSSTVWSSKLGLMTNCWQQVAITQFFGTSRPSNKKEWHKKLMKRN